MVRPKKWAHLIFQEFSIPNFQFSQMRVSEGREKISMPSESILDEKILFFRQFSILFIIFVG